MTDDIRIGPDAQINHTLSVLRDGEMDGEMRNEVRVIPGLHMHFDPQLEVSGHYRSPKGRMMELDIKTKADGDWAGLHLALNAPDLSRYGFIGLACRSSGPGMDVIRPCIRSGTPDGFADCFFEKHILAQPEESSHIDALPIHQRDLLPVHAPWRELVLFLPTASLSWSLLDLRVFIV